MNNFEFYNPVRVVFGKGQIQKLKELIPVTKKVLITYGGGSIKDNGIYEQVRTALADHQVLEFGGITPNPQFDQLMPAIELARREKIDFLLAVGGGSVIDATKFISSAIHFSGNEWDIVSKRAEVQETVPIGVVLTLPATGSEMNCFAVVSKGEDKLSFANAKLYPQFSILDPEVTYSLPQQQLGNGIVDAFVHTTEQYLTQNIDSPLQDRWAEGILKTLISEGPKVMDIDQHYESRANVMWSATMALNGIIGSGVVHDWATHMIGHELTALYGIDHARTLAVILPALLRVQKEQKQNKLLMYAHNVWELKNGTTQEKIEQAINLTEDFFNRMGLPTKLKVYKIEKNDFTQIAAQLRKHYPFNLGENKDIDQAKVLSILDKAY